ncbi:glycoside hydrolase, partial [Radiomyces spectabilis]|uniref:glycoside hydrolase n=1 Tax=Radiomyces spectabilis TaxID=64574 RepID=UPI00222118A3
TYALGHDEVKPLTNKTHDPFGGWGASLVDSLSTMMVMGLDETMDAVIPEISKINFQLDENVSVFESIIRYLGGLLSAYELSDARHPILLQKAEELAQALLPAFDTASGLPYHLWNPVKKESLNNSTLIAEVGTVQLEFMVLSHHTRNPVYAQKAQKITDWLDKAGYRHGLNIVGLFPTDIDVHRGRFKDATCTFGAMGDSAFEYFLKEYLLAEGSVPQYGRLYLHSIDSMKRYMLRQLPGSELLFLPPFDTRHHTAKRTMDHLTCFVPGMLAMGAKTFDRPDDMVVAKGLLETCVYMYRSTATGLCSENWQFENDEPYNPLTYSKSREQLTASRDWWYMQGNSAQDTLVEHETSGNAHDQETVTQSYQLPPVSLPRPSGLQSMDRRYLLRPETVESIWILYRVTGDPKYQVSVDRYKDDDPPFF